MGFTATDRGADHDGERAGRNRLCVMTRTWSHWLPGRPGAIRAPGTSLISVGAEACSISMLSWLQQRLLRVGGLPVTVRDLLPVTMASNAVAQSLPAGSLFAEGYAFRQYQRLGASRALGIWRSEEH